MKFHRVLTNLNYRELRPELISRFSLPVLSEVSCGLLPPVNFTTRSSTQGDGLYLDQITYTCITGYQHSGGTLVRNCTSAGTWDGSAPNCTSKVAHIKLLFT